MDGKNTYKLNVPADTPAKDFWSVIVYSMKTKGFVEGVDRVGLSSQVLDSMKKNDDGSVDVYFAPKPPEDFEQNWIPTGEDFFLLFPLLPLLLAIGLGIAQQWPLGKALVKVSPRSHSLWAGASAANTGGEDAFAISLGGFSTTSNSTIVNALAFCLCMAVHLPARTVSACQSYRSQMPHPILSHIDRIATDFCPAVTEGYRALPAPASIRSSASDR